MSITTSVVDVSDDTLHASIDDDGMLTLSGEVRYFEFYPNENNGLAEVEALRDVLNEFLSEVPAPADTDQVRAADVTFNEGMLRMGIVHKRPVEFSYAKGSGNVIERRRMIPAKIEKVGDHMTITGFDPDRDEPRAYRLDRIRGDVRVG